MNVHRLAILITLLLLCSCKNEVKARFEITNATGQNLDFVRISASNQQNESATIQLKAGESKTYWLDLTNAGKADGSYMLTYIGNENIEGFEEFGYLTNGYPTEEYTQIRIEKDTVIIHQEF